MVGQKRMVRASGTAVAAVTTTNTTRNAVFCMANLITETGNLLVREQRRILALYFRFFIVLKRSLLVSLK